MASNESDPLSGIAKSAKSLGGGAIDTADAALRLRDSLASGIVGRLAVSNDEVDFHQNRRPFRHLANLLRGRSSNSQSR